jgi:hypothetical protein
MFDNDNTNWRLSGKGNHWRKMHGRLLVVGESDFGIWARVSGDYIEGPFENLKDAMRAAENSLESSLPRGEWW